MLRSLHVEAMRASDLHGGHDAHVLFQASTIAALLDGRYDGDISFAELAEHGDTGLGTLNALDGEMIALGGRFYRADVEGRITEIDPGARTPFAAVSWFDPDLEIGLDAGRGTDLDRFRAVLEPHIDARRPACAILATGRFDRLELRSVPPQRRPYRPLTEVIADQNVFELGPAEGTLVGFRFPSYLEGIEVSGYHLHFIDGERGRGGHVLGFEMASGSIRIDRSCELHMELPPGLSLGSPGLAGETHAAIERAERSG